MSRAVPHYIRVVDAPGQPARTYSYGSKGDAMRGAVDMFGEGFTTCMVSVFEGKPDDGVERDPVRVWS